MPSYTTNYGTLEDNTIIRYKQEYGFIFKINKSACLIYYAQLNKFELITDPNNSYILSTSDILFTGNKKRGK